MSSILTFEFSDRPNELGRVVRTLKGSRLENGRPVDAQISGPAAMLLEREIDRLFQSLVAHSAPGKAA